MRRLGDDLERSLGSTDLKNDPFGKIDPSLLACRRIKTED
jgi:hypothetical protein